MKRKTIFWTVIGILMAFGLCLVLLGFVLGGELYSIDSFTDSSDSSEAPMTLSPDQYTKIENLDFDLSLCSVTIKQGDSFSITGDSLSQNEITESGKTWHVTTKKQRVSVRFLGFSFRFPARGGEYTITLPRDASFTDVNLDIAASEVDIEQLTSKRITINGGAGSVDIDSLTATETCKLKVGAGQITVDRGSLSGTSTLECSAGDIDLELSSLTGNMDAQCSAGNIDLQLPNTPDDYNFNTQTNLGYISIDGSSGSRQSSRTEPLATLDLDCSVGDIDVDFDD